MDKDVVLFGASQVVLVVKNLPASRGDVTDVGSILRSGRFSGGGHGDPLQHSCLGNPMDRGALQSTVHGVAKSQTCLSDWACVHMYKRIPLNHKKEWNNAICSNMDACRECHSEWTQKREKLYDIAYIRLPGEILTTSDMQMISL